MTNAQTTLIYNATAFPNAIAQTEVFSNAEFLIISTPSLPLNEGYEIATALLVDIQETTNIGGLDYVTDRGYWEINLDNAFSDTRNIILIPQAASSTGCDMYLTLLTDQDVYLEIYAVGIKKTFSERIDTLSQAISQLTLNGVNSTDLSQISLSAIMAGTRQILADAGLLPNTLPPSTTPDSVLGNLQVAYHYATLPGAALLDPGESPHNLGVLLYDLLGLIERQYNILSDSARSHRFTIARSAPMGYGKNLIRLDFNCTFLLDISHSELAIEPSR